MARQELPGLVRAAHHAPPSPLCARFPLSTRRRAPWSSLLHTLQVRQVAELTEENEELGRRLDQAVAQREGEVAGLKEENEELCRRLDQVAAQQQGELAELTKENEELGRRLDQAAAKREGSAKAPKLDEAGDDAADMGRPMGASDMAVLREEAGCQTDRDTSLLALGDDVIGLAGEGAPRSRAAGAVSKRSTGVALRPSRIRSCWPSIFVEHLLNSRPCMLPITGEVAALRYDRDSIGYGAIEATQDSAITLSPGTLDAPSANDGDDGTSGADNVEGALASDQQLPGLHLPALGSPSRQGGAPSNPLASQPSLVEKRAHEDEALDYGGFGGVSSSPFTPNSFMSPSSSTLGGMGDNELHQYTALPDSPPPDSPMPDTPLPMSLQGSSSSQERVAARMLPEGASRAPTAVAEAEAGSQLVEFAEVAEEVESATVQDTPDVVKIVAHAKQEGPAATEQVAEEPAWLADAAVSLSTSASAAGLPLAATPAADAATASAAAAGVASKPSSSYSCSSAAVQVASFHGSPAAHDAAHFLDSAFHHSGLQAAAKKAVELSNILDTQAGSVADIQAAVMTTLRDVENMCDGAITESEEEARVVLRQLEQRAELLAQREAEVTEAEARRRTFELGQFRARLGIAQQLVARRSLAASRRALLSQCWRCLCLNASARQLLADRTRFRQIIMQQASGQQCAHYASKLRPRPCALALLTRCCGRSLCVSTVTLCKKRQAMKV